MYHKFAKCITESVPAYSLPDYRSIFSNTRVSFWFNSKDETTIFNPNIPNTDHFNSF